MGDTISNLVRVADSPRSDLIKDQYLGTPSFKCFEHYFLCNILKLSLNLMSPSKVQRTFQKDAEACTLTGMGLNTCCSQSVHACIRYQRTICGIQVASHVKQQLCILQITCIRCGETGLSRASTVSEPGNAHLVAVLLTSSVKL